MGFAIRYLERIYSWGVPRTMGSFFPLCLWAADGRASAEHFLLVLLRLSKGGGEGVGSWDFNGFGQRRECTNKVSIVGRHTHGHWAVVPNTAGTSVLSLHGMVGSGWVRRLRRRYCTRPLSTFQGFSGAVIIRSMRHKCEEHVKYVEVLVGHRKPNRFNFKSSDSHISPPKK